MNSRIFRIVRFAFTAMALGVLALPAFAQAPAPEPLTLNQWALSGDWTVKREPILLNAAGGRIVYRFHARDVNLAMGPGERGSPVRFRVRIDGHPPGAAHGTDADAQGNGTVEEPRLYQLIRQPKPIADHTFDIEFLDPGLEALVFTFG